MGQPGDRLEHAEPAPEAVRTQRATSCARVGGTILSPSGEAIPWRGTAAGGAQPVAADSPRRRLRAAWPGSAGESTNIDLRPLGSRQGHTMLGLSVQTWGSDDERTRVMRQPAHGSSSPPRRGQLRAEVRRLRDEASAAVLRKRYAEALERYLQLEGLQSEEPTWACRAAYCFDRLGRRSEQSAALTRAANGYERDGFARKAAGNGARRILSRRLDRA